jgi:hypothetical protein
LAPNEGEGVSSIVWLDTVSNVGGLDCVTGGDEATVNGGEEGCPTVSLDVVTNVGNAVKGNCVGPIGL